ncbi:PhzF family phenazine biosynthesis protein [Kurthia sibirica]|uniref:Uncharacterized protein n=1 Tax=Kurthia sibirica TaxID=202750 RepID=A0A2U3APN2_9BACL|nr:PhzF family phenazine biosynthesis protein [Kurthia sibirica]PWI26415.1 hypothetical protein DEX24_03515 [Kurthia sibirica]GEK32976.1 hypothetical protein KSI01_05090 [Kurthia sibirica]
MKVHLIRVFRKGCNGHNIIGVVYSPKLNFSTMEMKKIAHNSKLDKVVFVTKSTKANIRLRFFTPDKEYTICFVSMFAAIHLLTNIEKDNYKAKFVSIETSLTVFKIDVMRTAFRTRDCQLIQAANAAFIAEKKPYWVNKNRKFNGYEQGKFLLEMPDTFATKPMLARHLLETMLVDIRDIDTLFYEFSKILGTPKFRMQIRYNDETVENFFISLYIQDIAAGRMIHLESMSKIIPAIDVPYH